MTLRGVWDERARSGVNVAKQLLHSGTAHHAELTTVRRRQSQRSKCRKVESDTTRSQEERSIARAKGKKRSRQLDRAVDAYLTEVQKTLVTNSFKLGVKRLSTPKPQKQLYTLTAPTPDAAYFAGRILNRTILEAYNTRPASRQEILSGLTATLRGKWTKTIIQADVRSFYESIPHALLMSNLDSNRRVPTLAKQWVQQLLDSYVSASGVMVPLGLPRGVGPSASLSHIYMLNFDNALKRRKECVFYARFVDDIVAVMAQADPHLDHPVTYLDVVQTELKPLGLLMSADITKCKELVVHLDTLPLGEKLEYLGYKIERDPEPSKLRIDLSAARKEKLKQRLTLAFQDFTTQSVNPASYGPAGHLLELRVRLLTSNTRLLNSKRDAFVGIRFSNMLLTVDTTLSALDASLNARITTLESNASLRMLGARLRRYSFVSGFHTPKYVTFNDAEWRDIAKAWKA